MRSVTFSVLLTTILTTAVVAAEPTQREITGTELIVQAQLDELEAPPAEISYQPSEVLAAAFPGYMFVLAQFGDVTPEDLPSPLLPRTLFAVPPDGKAQLLATPEDVLALFKSAFKPIKTAEEAKKAAVAALALEHAKFPDQPFATAPEELKAKPDGKGGFEVSGSSQPKPSSPGAPSGTGPISVTLSFGPKGQPAGVTTINNFRPRARPNQVSPADITADQPAAQKAAGVPVININSPTINKIFPGNTFFAPPATPASKPKVPSTVVAVDQNGKPQVLTKPGDALRFARQQSGKLKTEQQARDMLKMFLTLVTTMFPNQSFAPIQDSDITVTVPDEGGFDLRGTVFVAGDKTKFFRTHMTIGPKGAIQGTFNPRRLKD